MRGFSLPVCRQGKSHEANVPTLRRPSQADARFSRAHAHPWRPGGDPCASRQGALAARRRLTLETRARQRLRREQRLGTAAVAAALKGGERVVRTRFGVDEDVCSGDHSCIRLSGCPSLTIKDSSDPLKVDPVAHVNNGCVGCGLCGEVAHAAILCPSFFRAEIVQNPRWWDRALARVRSAFISWLAPA